MLDLQGTRRANMSIFNRQGTQQSELDRLQNSVVYLFAKPYYLLVCLMLCNLYACSFELGQSKQLNALSATLENFQKQIVSLENEHTSLKELIERSNAELEAYRQASEVKPIELEIVSVDYVVLEETFTPYLQVKGQVQLNSELSFDKILATLAYHLELPKAKVRREGRVEVLIERRQGVFNFREVLPRHDLNGKQARLKLHLEGWLPFYTGVVLFPH